MTGVRAVTVVLWALVALGPVLGGLALLRPASPVADVDQPSEPPAGVIGMAELVVAAHLHGRWDSLPTGVEPALPALRYRPLGSSEVTTTQAQADLTARRDLSDAVTGIGATPAGPDRWGVIVAVLQDDVLRAYQVTIAMSPDGPLAETLPTLVALPRPDRIPVPTVGALRAPDLDAPLTAAVAGFLRAYSTGQGELDRYVAADVELRPVATEDDIELVRLASAPFGERHLSVLAESRSTGPDGRVQILQFPLLMQQRDGRWEVRQVLPGLPLQEAPS